MHDTNLDIAERPDYMRPLKARWWLIALIGLVAAVGTYRYYANKPVYYQASTDLYMKSTTATDLLAGGSGGATDPNFLANQAVLLRTPGVATMAARWNRLPSDHGNRREPVRCRAYRQRVCHGLHLHPGGSQPAARRLDDQVAADAACCPSSGCCARRSAQPAAWSGEPAPAVPECPHSAG
jgi:hypothetical protein